MFPRELDFFAPGAPLGASEVLFVLWGSSGHPQWITRPPNRAKMIPKSLPKTFERIHKDKNEPATSFVRAFRPSKMKPLSTYLGPPGATKQIEYTHTHTHKTQSLSRTKTTLLHWPRHYTGYVCSLPSFSPHLQGKQLEVPNQVIYMP